MHFDKMHPIGIVRFTKLTGLEECDIVTPNGPSIDYRKEGITMLTTFLTALAQMFRIMFFLFLGFMFNRLHLVPRTAEPVLSRFVTLLFLPSLTLYSNIVECKITSLGQYSQWVLIGAALWLLLTLVGIVITRWFSKGDPLLQGVYRYAFSIPNGGAVSTPLVLAFYGTAGLFQYSLFTFVSGVMTYAWGVPQMQPVREKMTLRRFLKNFFNLNFICMLIGMTLGVLGAGNWMPKIVINIFSELGSCYVTLALILTGFSIANYPFSEVFGHLRVYIYTILRLIVFPLIVLVILYLFKAPLMLAIIAALFFAGPCGMNVVVFPAAYGQDCKEGASMVLISSMCSVLTIPVIYALVQRVFG